MQHSYNLLPKLTLLATKMQGKQFGRLYQVLLHQDTVQPDSASMTKAVIQELVLELIFHPPYSLDLASLDFHHYRSIFTNRRGTSCIY